MSASATASSRDDILRSIADQAANVRRTFEATQTKRRVASSATTAAAQHMASINRKRRFESDLADHAHAVLVANFGAQQKQDSKDGKVWKAASRTFHSPIACFTRPEKKRVVSIDTVAGIEAPNAVKVPCSRTTGGIILKSSPCNIEVSYNDVVCGKGQATSSLVGNRRYRVWIDLKKAEFAKALDEEHRRRIACSVVTAVATSVPQGRFLSLDAATGMWYDVGYARALGITLEALMAETGMMGLPDMLVRPPVARQPVVPRAFASRAA